MLRICLKYGFWIAISLILYFLFFRMLGLHNNIMMSVPNGLIFGFGIYLALKQFKISDPEMSYRKGMEVGFISGAVASMLFAVFMAFYLYQIDTKFAHSIMEQWNMADALGNFEVVLSIFIMGVSTSLILALTFMQLFKRSWNPKNTVV